MAEEFKPNIYPIIYWALAYGVIAGFLLFLVYILSRYITLVWFPVFLLGLVWGGYRNYQRQKKMWSTQSGVPLTPKSPVQEFKEAVSDVTQAAREMVAQQRAEDAEIANAEAEAEALAQEETLPPQPDRPTP